MTSTTLLIGRTPAAERRRASQSGDGPTRTSATAAAYRGQRSGASMATSRPSAASRRAVGAPGGRTVLMGRPASSHGRRKATPQAVATSRARPTTLRQSGRLAVISKSITASSVSTGSIRRHLEPAHREQRRQVGGGQADSSQFTEPGSEEFQTENCSRNRRSFS